MSSDDIEKGPTPAGNTRKVSVDIYNQICASYKGIDDFRAMLLGALPLATGAGILFTAKDVPPLLEHAWAIANFGILITLGLFCYEIYGITKCSALILAGTKIELTEQEFELSAEEKSTISRLGGKLEPDEAKPIWEKIRNVPGQFASRPQAVLQYFNEPFAAGIIYPAVLASWMVMLFLRNKGDSLQLSFYAWIVAAAVFVVGSVATVVYDKRLAQKFEVNLFLWLA